MLCVNLEVSPCWKPCHSARPGLPASGTVRVLSFVYKSAGLCFCLLFVCLLWQLEKDPEAPSAAAACLLPRQLQARKGKPGVLLTGAPTGVLCMVWRLSFVFSPKLPFPNPITFCASALPGQMQPGPG